MIDGGEQVSGTAVAATIGLVAVLASLSLVPAGIALARRVFPGRNVSFARWGFSHVGAAIFLYFAATLLVLYGARALSLDLEGAVAQVAVSAGLQLVTIAMVALFARQLDPLGLRSLGLRADRTWPAVAVGFTSYLIALPAIAGAAQISNWLWPTLGFELVTQDVVQLAAGLSGAELALFSALAVVVIPLCEELFFRAFLQPLLVQNLGDRGGVLITALLFTSVHANLLTCLPMFALSLVLGSVMLRTQHIASCWFVHALHNGLTLALLAALPQSRDWLGP
ncbi:MAG: CPBP family intramembrane metalloprotease [Planctomycetes bacterium]|nr:CPBP family intramembrane metalloprotease [Planctomycetota bacterium]